LSAALIGSQILLQVRELGDANLVVRQKSLLAARELLGNGVSYVQCIAAGITPAVVVLLKVRVAWQHAWRMD
jgi:hypothetical protein